MNAPKIGDTRPGSAPSANRPKIGDSRPANPSLRERDVAGGDSSARGTGSARRRRRGGRGRGSNNGVVQPVKHEVSDGPVKLDEKILDRRRGRRRKGRPVGRYMMLVQVRSDATQIAVLEGRALIEHYISRPADDISQIHGNIYMGRVQNVLPGMEAAFVDIGTPKNAVMYWGDLVFDPDDLGTSEGTPRIENLLESRQTIMCQVSKNPIAHKGARLTQEVSLPGRFVVLVPNSKVYGISKRLPDRERKRLRKVLDRCKPTEHGIIVRTAAEKITAEELERDVKRLLSQWEQIEALSKRVGVPSLLYREPEMAVRVIREEFNQDFRSVLIDDEDLFNEMYDYVSSVAPELLERLEYYDSENEHLSLLERHHVHEQFIKALDKKVWLPGGGSLIIETTEALTVVDVNTGKNVGDSNLEETVFRNNLEAAKEIPRQLRLRDIGGIIVIDFVDMDRRANRDEVMKVFRESLAWDKTRTQVLDISELGLVEMTRKRIGEGLLESCSTLCEDCSGRGVVLDGELVSSTRSS
ncbi:MAG: Rne/Rng family ribonuclease [Acidimicrobiia bacterium]|nr:Rne/Rng family ribonuclease [Acidimicrobiia bacterium]MYC58118.1 Rne/Rng family ribonuclease [Acidimicrobiia bacterium]MYG94392.1 Rne/Rng family ribonuclease [Acidimicrobiia bacterium]MYI30550.1 Rne/Rng family ribonuclease [Acidimicrobiia bacterium]